MSSFFNKRHYCSFSPNSVTVIFRVCFPPNVSRGFLNDDVKRSMPNSRDPSDPVHVTLEEGLNYGSVFGIYVASGYLSMASYLAQQSCFAGDDFDIPSTHPSQGAAITYMCG